MTVNSPEYSLSSSIGDVIEPKIQLEVLVASTKSEESVSVQLSTITGS